LSHIVEIKTEIRDEQAVRASCTRLQLTAPEHKTVRLFNATAKGLCVQLPGWQYPVVANLQAGQLQYDNYNGHWGEQSRLNQFLQAYAVEKARIEARKSAHQEAVYICDSCGEEIVVPVDISAGTHQDYVEDCPVCCHPMTLHVEIGDDGEAHGEGEHE
jgi:hypothetical protein